MSKEPSVIIFVPVKNARSTIGQCIESLLSLNYKNKIIFIIDNISTDGTYEILKNYGKKIKLKRMHGTVPKLHNSIIKEAKSDFIAYTNADCVVRKDWLNKLISGFTSNDIVATTGYVATPSGLNRLQTIIGMELENRFKNSPKFVFRGPDMNLCVRTDAAKKVMFDERFIWSWESDFGYRLTKKGKMKFIPNAIVYHYHRPTWMRFFKQQFNNAVINVILYWKHRDKILGDHISTTPMAFSLGFAYLSILFLILSFFNKNFLQFSLILLSALFFVFLREVFKLTKKFNDIPIIFGILTARTVAWVVGWFIGLILFLKRKWYKKV